MPEPEPQVSVPREVASYWDDDPTEAAAEPPPAEVDHACASLPMSYVADPRQRIEIHRKLAEITDEAGLERLREELCDRFGSLPAPAELLLQVSRLRVLAGERGIASVETKGDKLILTRNHDFITVGGKFPRLTRPSVKARLKEIERVLKAVC